MPTVLSLLPNRPVAGLLENHANYAKLHSYKHVEVDGTHIYGERQQALHRYHCIYQQLLSMADGDLLLVVDVFSLIYHPHLLQDVASGYDYIVSQISPGSTQANSSGMIFRNTSEVREKTRALVHRLGQWAMYLPEQVLYTESQILSDAFAPTNFVRYLSNGHLSCVQVLWHNTSTLDSLYTARPLVVSHAPEWRNSNGVWGPPADYDFRYVQALLLEAKACAAQAPSLAQTFSQAAQAKQEPEIHLNPDAEIAFVSLYTTNIAGYGNIHERSMLTYCALHGYGYHLYRGTPDFLPAAVTANWAKAHLIRHHLAQHSYVLWIDADIVAINQAQGMEELLQKRDFIVGTDHTAWAINSCIFGARNTLPMQQFFNTLCARVESVEDKTSVYASGGDQQILQNEMMAAGMINAECVVDAISLGTSPIYATLQHRFVHFPAQINSYRAAAMQVWEHLATPAPAKS